LVPEFEQTIAIERAMLLDLSGRLRRQGLGALTGTGAAPGTEGLGGRIGFELWRTLWSDGDQLLFLQSKQEYLDAIRALRNGQAAPATLRASMATRTRLERSLSSPLFRRYWFSSIAMPDYSRALDTVLRNETLRQMSLIAVACEQFRLRTGRYPQALEMLEPALPREATRDMFSSQPFRYRPEGARFLLYSVGPNGLDDGGDVALAPKSAARPAPNSGAVLSWDGLDVVWPAPATVDGGREAR
jgi:hypothetical protein